MTHNPLQYIVDILDSIAHVETYVEGKTIDNFEDEDQLFDSVMMRIQIIGESTSKVSEELKQGYPDIPWKQIVGLRNFISHDYAYLDARRVWLVIKNDLPKLKSALTDMKTRFAK